VAPPAKVLFPRSGVGAGNALESFLMAAVIVCPACDLAHHDAAAPERGRNLCIRCRAPLRRPETGRLDAAIALAVCSAVFFLLSNLYPLVEMQANGSTRVATLSGAALGMYAQGYGSLAMLVFLTTVVAPFTQIVTLLYLLIAIYRKRTARWHSVLFRVLTQVRPWTFVEVFILGALVALVRLSAFAKVVPGVSLWSLVCLMISLSALTNRTSPEQFWRWVERSRG
jgi:paraquat-inducible protein A